MTVILSIPHDRRPAVTRRLVELAGGDSKAVGSSTAGLVVSDALALAYLSNGHAPTGGLRAAFQALQDAAAPLRPVPPGIAATVRDAETQAGITADDTRAPAATGSSGARGSTRKRTAAAPREQQ